IAKHGRNIFHPSFSSSDEGRCFVAGILQRAAELTVFGNPLTNSYQRLGEYEAPKYITWSHRNRSPLITLPLADGKTVNRMKIRALDGCINPYIVFALLIHAGLDGIEQRAQLAPACDENLFTAPPEVRAQYTSLPASLCEAIACASDSLFIMKNLPAKARSAFFAAKQAEHDRIAAAEDQLSAERRLYFERY
ncbi:MAG: type I glutamate--ammonia ligase, partial [Eubacteriales bacterium]|nr:type I glutamate--ammonia ligase [Eubacteriales bacterium]